MLVKIAATENASKLFNKTVTSFPALGSRTGAAYGSVQSGAYHLRLTAAGRISQAHVLAFRQLITRAMRLSAVLLTLLLALAPLQVLAQDDPNDVPLGNLGQGMPMGGFGTAGTNQFTSAAGVTVIDDQTYVTLRLQPELSLGKFGMGLDVPLLVSLQGDGFRSEEFTDGVGFLRMIRYLRWGQKKRDPLYAKVGDLSGATMGFGFIMYQYSNVGSFEERPIGAEVDVNLDQTFGVEALYSDFSETGVMGARPYVRPLRAAGVDLPLVRNLEVGLLYVTDRSPRAIGFYPASDSELPADSLIADEDGSISAWGFDVGLPLRLGSIVSVVPYAAYANLSADTDLLGFEPGSGAAFGVNFGFDFVANVLQVNAKLERRFFGEHFTGSYFNGAYEAAKLGGTPPVQRLRRADESYGVFGALYGHLINKVIVGGSLAIPDQIARENGDVVDGAYLHLEAAAPDLIPKTFLRATYNRDFIEDLGDALALDENSNLEMRVGYKLNPFLLVGTDYRWTFVQVEDESGEEQLEVNNYVFPFVALQFDLPVGN